CALPIYARREAVALLDRSRDALLESRHGGPLAAEHGVPALDVRPHVLEAQLLEELDQLLHGERVLAAEAADQCDEGLHPGTARLRLSSRLRPRALPAPDPHRAVHHLLRKPSPDAVDRERGDGVEDLEADGRRPHADSDPDRDEGGARERADAAPARGEAARGRAALLAPEHAVEVGERAQPQTAAALDLGRVGG